MVDCVDLEVGLRADVAVRSALTSQLSLRVHVEQGENAYTSFVPASPERSDDYLAFGGQLRIALGRMTFTLEATVTDYESNLPGFDQTTTAIRSGLTLGSGSGSPWG